MNSPKLAVYPASRIASELGISAAAIRKACKGTAVVRMVVRGQTATGYRLADLPSGIQQRLSRIATAKGHRGIHALLESPAELFETSAPIGALPAPLQAEAFALRDALAPILGSGEALSISELARQAALRLATNPGCKLRAPRTLRRIIARVMDRDGGRRQFDRIELYSEEFVSAVRPRSAPEAAPQLTNAANLSLLADSSDPVDVEEIVRAGKADIEAIGNDRQTLRRILDFIEDRWPDLPLTRSALRQRLQRQYVEPEARRTPGRRPLAVLNDEELRIARGLYAQYRSCTLAFRELAKSPICRQEVADAILARRRSKHTITPTLRQQISSTPEAVLDWHKSPTKVKREAFLTPRTLTHLGRNGNEARILPGMLAERDDMSNNFLFWIAWPWGGDKCSDKFGVRIARGQNLLHIDVGSLRFLSMNMLVRLRDSYRADDIWQWVGQTYRDIGIPEIGERWERGIWQANQLHGTKIDAGHTDQGLRLGGIQALGRRIITSQSPTTKIIENRFRYYQRVCATIPGQIGANRGEMEKVNKLWTECRDGRRDPRTCFLSYEDAVTAAEAKLHDVNSEPVEGAIYNGIPNEIWLREGGEQRMKRLSADQTYLFSRDRHEVTVNKGHALVRKTAPDGVRMAWYFHHEDLWRFDGRKVALFMDDHAPASGATIVHADRQDAGKVLGHAELVEGCPQFALGLDTKGGRGSQAMLDAADRRKAFENAVRSEYRAIGIGHTIARGTYASDGAGRSRAIETTPPEVESFEGAVARQLLKRAAAMALPESDEIEKLEAEARRRGDILV